MKKKSLKEAAKDLWDFYKTITSSNKIDTTLPGGWKCTIDMYYDQNAFGFDVGINSVTFDAEVEKLFSLLNIDPPCYEGIIYDTACKGLNSIEKKWNTLIKECLKAGEDSTVYVSRSHFSKMHKYKNFKQFYSALTKPDQNEVAVKLTHSYDAIVKKDNDFITVGCQNIAIEAARDVVATWDKLNQKTK